MQTCRWVSAVMVLVALVAWSGAEAVAQGKARRQNDRVRDEDLPYPPTLPGNQRVVTDRSESFLQRPASIRDDVTVAQAVPTIDFMFYPNQTYPGKPWSNWGDGTFADGKYYSAIGDHYAINRGEAEYGTGTAFVYEYDPQSMALRSLVNVAELLGLPEGHYTPGKIHSRIDLGRDGWLYYSTHRGSSRAAIDANNYRGDWILRTNPPSGVSEVVVAAPVPKHSIPTSVLDPQRMIFYGGTAAGPDAQDQQVNFFAYDVANRRMLYAGAEGPARAMVLAQSTGHVYFVPGKEDGEVLRFDPASPGTPVPIGETMGIRAATSETDEGFVYTVSTGQRADDATIWRFNTRTEKAEAVGTASVGTNAYVTSLDADPTGRFLYYVPGAHGGADRDGSPLVQFEVETGRKKIIAFLHPFYQDKYGFTPKGTYSTAVSDDGSLVFITWNVSRGTRAWDCCGLAVVHVPASER